MSLLRPSQLDLPIGSVLPDRATGLEERSASVKNVYVGNLSFQSTEEDLRDWFANAGVTSSNVQIIRDRFSGNSRGFGFVEIADDAEAEHAIEQLNGKEFQGRTLVVNEARPKGERGGGGGYGRGGGGGRGRNW